MNKLPIVVGTRVVVLVDGTIELGTATKINKKTIEVCVNAVPSHWMNSYTKKFPLNKVANIEDKFVLMVNRGVGHKAHLEYELCQPLRRKADQWVGQEYMCVWCTDAEAKR